MTKTREEHEAFLLDLAGDLIGGLEKTDDLFIALGVAFMVGVVYHKDDPTAAEEIVSSLDEGELTTLLTDVITRNLK